ncbi:RNA pseudouridine synthase [filamentous cyanobacterium Phorm 6]|nr:RNA pseudouridine synthase [filamentous cyanobacterium Phorm 6]
MLLLHSLIDFTDCFTVGEGESIDLLGNYWYEGLCPQSGELLRLPRTRMSEEIARGLMQYLAADDSYDREGKMYGILLVEMPSGEQRILKAFSGLLNGCSTVDGWVPPIPGRDRVAVDEARTLTQLEAMKQELITLNQLPQRQEYETLFGEFELQLQVLSERHRNCRQQRDEKRQLLCQSLAPEILEISLEQLNQASRLEGIERKQLKRRRDETLQPLKGLIAAADGRMRGLKQRRKELSRELQTQMHAAYTLVNFLGKSRSISSLMPTNSIPTGTGDCCAPKLLHCAALHNLKPLAMAEFWWGPPSGDKVQGEFYGACADRCQPLMGFLLSGLSQNQSVYCGTGIFPVAKMLESHPTNQSVYCGTGILPVAQMPQIIYENKWLIAINKPSGLLSVPGRYLKNQDSILSRLRNLLPDSLDLTAVHRLDLETSGILLLARDKEISSQLRQQFENRQVHKVYEAVLSGILKIDAGTIELPLWGDPENRPYQQVHSEYGKPSVTRFQLMAREGKGARVEFLPLTGRTHQLRVHAADVGGLGIPILGDRLYGCRAQASRLHLHARELCFEHPQSGEWLHLQAATPF